MQQCLSGAKITVQMNKYKEQGQNDLLKYFYGF